MISCLEATSTQQPWQRKLQELIVAMKIRVCLKNLAMQLSGGAEQPGRNGKPLLLVSIEERGGSPGQDRVQFPAEIVGILHAGIHALAAGGLMNVCRIARYKNAAHAIAINHSYISPVERKPGCIVQAEFRHASTLIDDLLKAFERRLIWLFGWNLCLKLK